MEMNKSLSKIMPSKRIILTFELHSFAHRKLNKNILFLRQNVEYQVEERAQTIYENSILLVISL